MTKRLFAIFFMAVVSLAAFGQSLPIRFGIEADGRLKKVYPYTFYDSPAGSAYTGVFAEYHVTDHFSGKFGIGINNTYFHQDRLEYHSIDGSPDIVFPKINQIKQSLSISLAPRIYLFSTERSQGVNLFAALPVTYESTSFQKKDGATIPSELRILPTLGFRYDFNKHWAVEASGGLGWTKYFNIIYFEQSPPSKTGYELSAGIRYAF
jgi:hypothetical protein